MKKSLLIITQTVDENDSNLGFFCGWLNEFAKQADRVYVLANKVGNYSLPDNVRIMSLGKERNAGRVSRLFKFWYYLFKYLPKVDAVFAHMCPEYVVYGAWAARLYGKKIGLWYLHKSLTFNLRLASKLVNYIFTAHADGCPIKSAKVIVTGHGIEWWQFEERSDSADDKFKILTVGRISASKDLLLLLKAAIILQQKMGRQIKFIIVGEAYLESDQHYLGELKTYLKQNQVEPMVEFAGSVPHSKIYRYYSQADIFLNASRTGGVDKAVLEAMASSLPVITSNPAFKEVLPAACLFAEGSVDELVTKSLNYKQIDVNHLRALVVGEHSLENTVNKIIMKL